MLAYLPGSADGKGRHKLWDLLGMISKGSFREWAVSAVAFAFLLLVPWQRCAPLAHHNRWLSHRVFLSAFGIF